MGSILSKPATRYGIAALLALYALKKLRDQHKQKAEKEANGGDNKNNNDSNKKKKKKKDGKKELMVNLSCAWAVVAASEATTAEAAISTFFIFSLLL